MPIFARLGNTISVKPKASCTLRPEVMVNKLNCRFHLGLDVIPSFKQNVIRQVISASTKNSFFLAQLNNSIGVGALAGVNKILRVADLEIVRVNDNHRIRYIEKQSVITRAANWVSENCLAASPITTGGFPMPIDRTKDSKFSHIIFAKGRGKDYHPRLTEEEYADNKLIKRLIEERKEDFLKEPDKGFTVDNIQATNFLNTTFIFIDRKGEKKGFIGATLLKKRGKKPSKAAIAFLLRDLGIKAKGKVKEEAEREWGYCYSRLTKEEYADDKLIRRVIEEKKNRFLKKPDEGFIVGNVQVAEFLDATFTFMNRRGEKKGFIGATLLISRRKESSKEGILSLLRDLGINVKEKVEKPLMPTEAEQRIKVKEKVERSLIPTKAERRRRDHYLRPTEKEYADDELMKKAIEGRKNRFLKELDKGFIVDNIRFHDFLRTTFTFIDRKGEKKGFTGVTLLKKRGNNSKKRGILSLLRDLGINVKEKVEKPLMPTEAEQRIKVKEKVERSLMPTEAEHERRELMSRAIKGRKESFLIEPKKGLRVDNIDRIKFLQASFVYQDENGVKKSFKGIDLLRNRRKGWTQEGIARLLRELGIKVHFLPSPPPSPPSPFGLRRTSGDIIIIKWRNS